MISASITAIDICEITGFSRHKLRGLLRELPEFAGGTEKARVARKYTLSELLLITICCELEESFGLRRKVIGALTNDIKQCLSRTRNVHMEACLHIRLKPQVVTYLSDLPDIEAVAGLVVPLGRIYKKINAHIEQHSFSSLNQKRLLNIGSVEADAVVSSSALRSDR